ncbi:MAG: ParA family protein [Methanosarcinales archaeon]|nr:ParA family protein [Methanosarcinales archaeon]
MTKIISISNQKGGVGKTTTAVNLSAGLVLAGKKVLLIDTDPQANATINLLPPGYQPEFTIKDVFYGTKLNDAICTSVMDGLDIVPSLLSFAAIESEFLSKIGRELILRRSLDDQVKQEYDFIIFDTPPALGMISINTLVAADEVIVPVHEFYALEGVELLMNVVSQIKEELNPKLRVSAFLLTMHDERTNLAKDVKEKVNEIFGDMVLNTTIPRNVKLAEAPSHKQTIFDYADMSTGAKAYTDLTSELLDLWR